MYKKCATQIVFFIQITGLCKGQIKKHFLIKLQQIDKRKEGSAPSMHIFLFMKVKQNVSVCQANQNFKSDHYRTSKCIQRNEAVAENDAEVFTWTKFLSVLLILLAT